MSILDRFFSAFRQQEVDEHSQPRREASLDLLVLTMYADRHLALSEQETLDAKAAELEWDSVTSLGDFLAESVVRARNVIDGRTDRDEYLADIAERLGDPDARLEALRTCEELVGADGKLREEEVQLLKAAERLFAPRL